MNDTYPLTWSAGGGFENEIFDFADADTMKNYVRTSTGNLYHYDLILDSSVSDGFRHLTTISAKTGQWPVWRQGAVSWRAAIHPYGIGCFQTPIVVSEIRDHDILRIGNHSFFSPNIQTNYANSSIIVNQNWYDGTTFVPYSSVSTPTTITTSRIKGLPAESIHQYDNSMAYRQKGTSVVPADMANADLQRVNSWDGYNHEINTIDVKLKFCTLCAGDIVEVSSSLIYGISEWGGGTYTNKRAMVTSVDFAISEQRCTLELAILPTRPL